MAGWYQHRRQCRQLVVNGKRLCRSVAAGAGTGADWANAYTTLSAAFTAKAAGDVFFVSEDHAETGAVALNIDFEGDDFKSLLCHLRRSRRLRSSGLRRSQNECYNQHYRSIEHKRLCGNCLYLLVRNYVSSW